MTTSDDWVKHATTDDSLVAQLLLRLAGKPPSLSLDWTVRQRRSRAPARELNFDAEMKMKKRRKRRRKNKTEQTRASPTTPLSWSAGNSSISGGDGDFSDDLRSKVSVKNEAMSTTSKRPRKKKTLAELREEETLLLKERKKLRKEVESMRLSVEERRATNEALYRLKLDFECKKKFEARQRSVAPSLSDNKSKDVEIRETGFPLPDLNLPADGNSV